MFNEEYFEQRHNALLALIAANSVDVVCLQEVRAEVVDSFNKILGAIYRPVSTTLQPPNRLYGEMIYVKKELEICSFNVINLQGKMGRHLLHAIIKKNNILFNVATFHLESMNCKKVRREQLGVIWKYLSGRQKVVCCGDTNQTDKENYTVNESFYDVWKKTDRKVGKYTYYSKRFWDGDRKNRYDKFWVSNDIETLSFGILGNTPISKGVWISDHDGLYAVFK